ncbi:MAG: glycosyltransferase family 39 protein [Candidatus Levybacteria bacterium]|nr:glycosyltransferase family 39 protein [Candidatus Levybacteria bacterium]
MKRFYLHKHTILLVLILSLAAALRLYQLGNIPLGVTHDELGYIYNAYAISQTGSNVFGERFPFLTWMVRDGFPFLPVPIYFSAPFFFFLPLSAFAGRLPAALLGVGDVFLLFLIVKKLFRSDKLALLSGFFLAISPWHLHFSRSAYDPNFALFFYLLAIASFLHEAERKKMPFVSSLSFLFAIFSYRGMSAVFVPLAIILIYYTAVKYRMSKKSLGISIVSICIVTASFLFVVLSLGSSYTQEALFFNDPKIQEAVDKEIREAKGPLWVRRLFLNKPAYIVSKLRENYLRSYSPEFLFLHTEPHKIYSIWSRGRIYFIDIIFIALGIFFLYKLNKRASLIVFSFLLIGGLPGLLGGSPYSARNFFISSSLPILSAGGVICLFLISKRRQMRYVVGVIIIFLYSYSFGSYLFDYYERYSYQFAESWAKSLKDVSFLIQSRGSTYDTVIVANTTFGDVVQYAFYAGIPVETVQTSWRKRGLSSQGGDIFKIRNVVFQPNCERVQNLEARFNALRRTQLLFMHDDCDKKTDPLMKVQDYYGNTVWKVYYEIPRLSLRGALRQAQGKLGDEAIF